MKNGLTKKEANQQSLQLLRLERSFSLLRNIYNLPTIEHKEVANEAFFKYVKQKHFFLIIAVFDLQDRILILRDFGRNFGWELLGGSIGPKPILDYGEAAQRISQSTLGTYLFDIQPIAFAKNNFSYKTQKITHEGLVLIARVNGKINADETLEWGFFKDLPSSMFTANHEIAHMAVQTIKKKFYKPAIAEITSVESMPIRSFFHKYFIKTTVGAIASYQLKKGILKYFTTEIDSFLDTSCGDDNMFLQVAHKLKPSLIVCNDISIHHLQLQKKRAKKANLSMNVIFTHHDVLDLPLNYKFDVVFSKNTLHHFKNDTDIYNVLKTFKKLGRSIVLVDIEDIETSLLARIWNAYYRIFLNDQGQHFLSYKKLKKILKRSFEKNEYSLTRIRTIRGNYLLAHIKNLD